MEMTKDKYEKMTAPFRKIPIRAAVLHTINKITTLIVFLSYPILLILMHQYNDTRITRAFWVPLDTFVIISVLRYFINRKRPYEVFDMEPVIKKDTKGKSMPSRHVFSATIIAMTYLCYSPFWMYGIFLMVVSVLIAVVRVLSGVHYISDVVVGMILGVISGLIGYVYFAPLSFVVIPG